MLAAIDSTRAALRMISDAVRPLTEGTTFEVATLVNVAMRGWHDADAPAAALVEHFARMALTGPGHGRATAIQDAVRNLTLPPSPSPEAARERAWRAEVERNDITLRIRRMPDNETVA